MSKTTLTLLAIIMLFISIFSYVSIADTKTTQEGEYFLLFFSDFFIGTFIVSAIFDLLKKRKKKIK